MTSSTNRNYITYQNTVRRQPRPRNFTLKRKLQSSYLNW